MPTIIKRVYTILYAYKMIITYMSYIYEVQPNTLLIANKSTNMDYSILHFVLKDIRNVNHFTLTILSHVIMNENKFNA